MERALTIAVASGKGGTGKTMVATNLAALVARSGDPVTLVDCDVEAPNDHLFFAAGDAVDPVEVTIPEARAGSCPAGCTVCRDTCRFGAIRILGGRPTVFPDLCHSCGACIRACPSGVLSQRRMRVGEIESGTTESGLRLITGRMDVGQAKAPPMIGEARRKCEPAEGGLTILDAPPGAACSAVATLQGADLLLLVTEPTVFGLHDLSLMVELARGLGLTAVVVLNREGAGSTDIAGYCDSEGLPVVARIPFDRGIAERYAAGELLVESHPEAEGWFSALWQQLRETAASDREARS
jgi:MinD superfamily P-loop ATPase